MIDPAQIPDGVVEAAARAAYELDAGSPSDTWQQASKLAKVIYRGQARAAISAALTAWPGVQTEGGLDVNWLILPLTQKDATDE